MYAIRSYYGGFSGKGGNFSYDALTSLQNGTLPEGFTLGVLSSGITIGDVTFPNLGAVVHAYKRKNFV